MQQLWYEPAILKGSLPIGAAPKSTAGSAIIADARVAPSVLIDKQVRFGSTTDGATPFGYTSTPVSSSGASVAMSGGKCVSTKTRVVYAGRSRVVYLGPRGGRYVKVEGKLVRIRQK